PVSVKYRLPAGLKGSVLKKVVVDYNDVVHVLTDKGLCRLSENEIVKDLLYRPLADKIPVDIVTQETTGYLYYLYDSCFLTNAYAGVPYGALPDGQYNKIAVAADGRVLLAGDDALGFFNHAMLSPIPAPQDKIISLQVYNGIFYVLCTNAVYRITNTKAELLHSGSGLQAFTPFKNMMVLGTARGYYGIDLLTKNNSL